MAHKAASRKAYKVYFRIWPFIYFVARESELRYLCLVKKEFDGAYYWEEI